MAEVTINNSPIHSDSIITALYGETGPNWSGIHTGADFAPYNTTPANPDLYSVCTGVVTSVITYTGSQALGNQIVIQETATGLYWRYCHMVSPSSLSVGANVTTATKVGNLGATGNVTGPHLHLELSDLPYWDTTRTHFQNPLTALGIPNARGTIVHFDGTTPPEPPEPPTPTQTRKKKGFNWPAFTRVIRNRRNI